MNLRFKIGDLIGIKSSTDNKLIETCPPGIILNIETGYPITPIPERFEKPRTVATILWDDGIEEKVDIEWLTKISEI